MTIEDNNSATQAIPPQLSENELREWEESASMDRHRLDVREMLENQNYDFELALEYVRGIAPTVVHLDILAQAALATSVIHLKLV